LLLLAMLVGLAFVIAFFALLSSEMLGGPWLVPG
jgi:hypothetical protein